MKEKIPLEEQGSAELHNALPLMRLEGVLSWLLKQPNLPQDFRTPGQAIEVTSYTRRSTTAGPAARRAATSCRISQLKLRRQLVAKLYRYLNM
ncbi:hypothetical protein IAQ61_001315 [Plenodomus lingam]|uniref:uncharacterized protein n=1 Tax=Leptosphaeria maculans TaxID=5022 RepID=UPI00331B2BB0|nr:hypothetical protein IAQ61_001315 [Plenodomus lingam]